MKTIAATNGVAAAITDIERRHAQGPFPQDRGSGGRS